MRFHHSSTKYESNPTIADADDDTAVNEKFKISCE